MRRFIVTCVAALFMGVALAGCATDDGGNGTTTTPTGTTPGGGGNVPNPNVYTIMSIGEAESLDPAYDYESSGGQIISNVYETLYGYEGESAEELVPVLAADMPEYNDDRTELTIPLRQGVTFHDGTEMTAEDVKFSLDRIIIHNDPDSPAWIYYVIKGADEYGHLDVTNATQADRDAYLAQNGVEVVDDYTVRIRLEHRDPAFLYRLAFQAASIVSKDAFCANKPEGSGDDCFAPPGETRHAWADDHEAGSGPFMLERWNKGQEIILQRFDDYWGDKPALERVIVRKVDDFNTRLTALRAGEADDVYIPVDHAQDAEGLDGVEIIEQPSWSVSFIGYVQKFCGGPEASGFQECMSQNSDAVPRGADGQPDPLFFSDINMRKAWSYAFDYETYINDIVGGHGQLLNGALPEGIFGYSEDVEAPRQDLDAAREALAASNHPDGFQVTIFYNSGNTVREKTAQLLAQNLESLGNGIQVDTQALDWSTAFLPKQRAQALPVFYLGWLPDYAFPDNYVVTFAHSENGVYAKRIGYENPQLDAKMDELVQETDEEALREGWREVVQELNDDFAFMWLAQASNFHVQRDWVNGYYYNPMHSGQPNAGDFAALSKG